MPIIRMLQVSVVGLLLLSTAVPTVPDHAAPAASAKVAQTVVAHRDNRSYFPMPAGRVLTYETNEGQRFTFSFGDPQLLIWWDDTVHKVVPVADSRCGCRFLFENWEGGVRVIGSIQNGRTERWGEFTEVLPANPEGPRETIVTPAGRFEEAVSHHTAGQTMWFAPGVGLIKTDQYQLVRVENR